MPVNLNKRQTATVLAALRYFQRDMEKFNGSVEATANHFEECEPLGIEDIDALCEQINCDQHPRDCAAADLLRELIDEFPEFGTDEEIDGADAIDTIGVLVGKARDLLGLAPLQEGIMVKVMVAGDGPSGPAFFFCKVKGTDAQYQNGDFYETAKREAVKHGLEPMPLVAFDENDPAVEDIIYQFEWESASVFEATEGGEES